MKPFHPIPAKSALMLSLTAILLLAPAVLRADPQHTTALQPDATTPHRTRLILKDGSYQIVMSYKIVGNVVRYVSAERGGAQEEIPLSLVDMDATQRWERQHAKPDPNNPNNPDDTHAPAIDPELLKEEADRAALTPEVAKDLRLPEGDSTLVLDTYRGTPELVPLAQTDSRSEPQHRSQPAESCRQSALRLASDRPAQRREVAHPTPHQRPRPLYQDRR